MTQNCIHRRKRPGFTNKNVSYGCVTLVQKRTDKNVSTLGWGMGRGEERVEAKGRKGWELNLWCCRVFSFVCYLSISRNLIFVLTRKGVLAPLPKSTNKMQATLKGYKKCEMNLNNQECSLCNRGLWTSFRISWNSLTGYATSLCVCVHVCVFSDFIAFTDSQRGP